MRWLITLHGVDANGERHSVVHEVPLAAVKVTPEDVEKAKRDGLVPDRWLADVKSAAAFRKWKDDAEKNGFFTKDGKHCTFTAIDSNVVDP